LADRRISIGLDLDEVEALVLGHLQRFVARQHADHLAVGADHSDPRDADLVVAAVLLFGGANTASPEGRKPGARRATGSSHRFLTDLAHDTTVRPGILRSGAH